MNGWYGFYTEDEYGYPEEFLSVKTIDKAQKMVNQLQEDIKRLKKQMEAKRC